MSARTRLSSYLLATAALAAAAAPAAAQGASYKGPDFDLTAASVTHLADLDLLVFEQRVAGTAGATVPTGRGQLDGAPVLGYVFPTSLPSTAVGFAKAEGIVALAVTSHPETSTTRRSGTRTATATSATTASGGTRTGFCLPRTRACRGA